MTPEIVLGPPGTGKTTTLLGVVDEELTRGVPPDRIGYVSFTRRAAKEAMERACKKFGLLERDFRYFRTLHSLCFHGLGLSNGDVLEGKKMVEFGDWLGIEVSENRMSDDGSTFGFTQGDRALFMENLARVSQRPLREQFDDNCDGLHWAYVERISRGLAQFKRDRQLVDYTDMLQLYVTRGHRPKLDILIVDEAQDLSDLQWAVVWFLAQECRRVVIAGDDDQAIYKWAGAAVDTFVEMQGSVRVLGQSYRVPRAVQRLSSGIIETVRHRREKEWRPREADGVLEYLRSPDEVDFRTSKDILVLGRNAFVLRDIMKELQREGIIYEWRGHSSIRQSMLDAIGTWEKLRSGDSVLVEDAKIVYEYMSSGKCVKRGFKTLPGLPDNQPVDIATLRERGGLLVENKIWHEAMDRIGIDEKMYMLTALRNGEKISKRPRVRVSTIHGAKGGQAEHVVLMTDMASRTYQEARAEPDNESRVWYVAVTRTMERLTVVAPRTSMYYSI